MPLNLVGHALGKYQLTDRLGRGGMADVYKAYQPGLERYVAIKVMHPHLAEQPDFVARFRREAQSVSALHHPNIVQVFDFDVQDDHYYMAMAYIDGGRTLKQVLKECVLQGERIPTNTVLLLAAQVCDALGYAHRRGMIHRDVKPANVLIPSLDYPILSDFGIAHLVDVTTLTRDGAMVGTPAYMSPEQATGGKVSERTDIYALGVTLYEMLTGQPPYDADTPYGVILKHLSDPLIPPHLIVDLPMVIEPVVLKALAKQPDDRFASADDMAKALRNAAAEVHDNGNDSWSGVPVQTSVYQVDTMPGDALDSSEETTNLLDANPAIFGTPAALPTKVLTAASAETQSQTSQRSRAGFPSAARIAILGGIILLAAALAWLLGFGPGTKTIAPAPPGSIYAVEVVGQVELSAGGNPPRPLKTGDTIAVGAGDPATTLRSMSGSQAIISLADGSALYLAPDTTLGLDQLVDPSRDSFGTLLTLHAGGALIKVAQSGDSFTVKSPPGARVEVSGTALGVRYAPPTELFDVDCLAGSCRLFGGPGVSPVDLASCQHSAVIGLGMPSIPDAASSHGWREMFGDAAPECVTPTPSSGQLTATALAASASATPSPSATASRTPSPTALAAATQPTLAVPTESPLDPPTPTDAGNVLTAIPTVLDIVPTLPPILPTLPPIIPTLPPLLP